jgi:hypothetical protein
MTRSTNARQVFSNLEPIKELIYTTLGLRLSECKDDIKVFNICKFVLAQVGAAPGVEAIRSTPGSTLQRTNTEN